MKKIKKTEGLSSIFLLLGSAILLLIGSFKIDAGKIGEGILYIMSSLYTVMWLHADLINNSFKKALENTKKQEDTEAH